MSYLAMVPSRSFWNSFLTSPVSAPERRRKAAASKVRLPVRMVNCLVSSTIGQQGLRLGLEQVAGSSRYWSSSVTSSLAEEA